MIHRIQQHVAVKYVHIHVITRDSEERVEYAAHINDAIFVNAAKKVWN